MNSIQLRVFLVAIFGASFASALYPQWIKFYEDYTCFSKYDYTYESVANVTSSPIMDSPKCISFRGAWTIRQRNTTSNLTTECRIVTNGGSSLLNSGNLALTSVEKHLTSDLEEFQVALYEKSGFEGERFLVNTTEYRFETPRRIFSHIFTGVEPFTIFTGTNFDGTSTCIQADSYGIDSEHGITGWYSGENFKLVGSIRRGCPGQALSAIKHEDDSERIQKFTETVENTMNTIHGIQFQQENSRTTYVVCDDVNPDAS